MNLSMPGLPVRHQLLESTQTYVHWVAHAIQPYNMLSAMEESIYLTKKNLCLLMIVPQPFFYNLP